MENAGPNAKAMTELERIYHHAKAQTETAAAILDKLSQSTERLCGGRDIKSQRAERVWLEIECPDGALFAMTKELNQIQALLSDIGRKADLLSEVI